jgi:hypothetical protein
MLERLGYFITSIGGSLTSLHTNIDGFARTSDEDYETFCKHLGGLRGLKRLELRMTDNIL